MGVSGSGKTTMGRRLAAALGRPFLDADSLHSPEARAKMARGEGLTEHDRAPWLDRVAAHLAAARLGGRPAVVACSVLRAAHRARLREADPALRFVWLDVPEAELRRRLEGRAGHFAGPALLASQLRTFEAPGRGEALRIAGSASSDEAVADAIRRLGLTVEG